MRSHQDIEYVKTYKHRGFTYYGASITILRIRYRKTFPYTPKGYQDAITWKKELINSKHANNYISDNDLKSMLINF